MSRRREPFTKVLRVDSSVSATINQTKATTYIGIEADTGRYELQEVNSPKQLVEKYSTMSKPDVSCGITMLHAGKFMEQFSGHVKRVNKDTVHPGVDSLGNSLYFDKNYNLIDTITRVSLSTNEKDLDQTKLLLKVTYSDNSFKYFGNSLVTNEVLAEQGIQASDFVLINQNNSDAFIRELAANDEYFPQDEVFSVTYGNAISIYGLIVIENIFGFDVNVTRNPFYSAIKLDTESDWGSVDPKILLTTANGIKVPSTGTQFAIDLSKSNFKYGESTYSPQGGSYTGTTTFLALDEHGIPKAIHNYRDALMSMLEVVYSKPNAPISYIDEDFVIKHVDDENTTRIYPDDGSIFKTGISNSLSSIVSGIYYMSAGVGHDWEDLQNIDANTPVGAVEKIKFSISGQLKHVDKGYVTICTAYLNQQDQAIYTRHLFYFGYENASEAINAFNSENGSSYTPGDLTLHDITSPNEINLGPNVFSRLAVASDLIEEVMYTEENCINGSGDTPIYLCSTVSEFEINPPSIECGYNGYLFNGYSVLTKLPQGRNTITIANQASNMSVARSDGMYWITIDKYTFYNKDLPNVTINGTAVKVASTELTPSEFIALVKSQIINYFATCASLSNGTILIGSEISTENDSCLADEGYGPNTKVFNVLVTAEHQSTDAKFAVVQKFTSSAKLSQFSIERDTDNTKYEVYYLNTTYAFTNHDDPISFDPSAIDGNGKNLYYEKFNFEDRDFHLELLNEGGQINEFSSGAFGDEVKPRKATEQDFIDAIEDLKDSGFKPFFVFDAGLTSNNYYKALAPFAESFAHAMVPAATPAIQVRNGRRYKFTTEDALNFKSSMGNSTNRFVIGPSGWQRDVVFGDISFECSPTYYYLQKVLSNTNAETVEFQPIYWKMQGRIETSDPVIGVTKTSDRETLLDANINSVIRDLDGRYSYFNKNYTDQVETSVFSEEQNVRIDNKIAHIADNYIDLNVLGKNHTTPLRKKTQDSLTGLINDGIFANRNDDTAKAFRVVVDETNNPDFGRKITVDIYVTYNESVDEALVYTRTEQLQG